jgi:hypothetical protein
MDMTKLKSELLDFVRIPVVPEAPEPSRTVTPVAPADWQGTPMEMAADAFGMKSPWRSRDAERRGLARRKKARNRRKDKAAKATRKRNRR